MRMLLAPFISLLTVASVIGQGLEYDPNANVGASNAVLRLNSIYSGTKAWRASYMKSSTVCSGSHGSLCASGSKTQEEEARLLMATSPLSFDARAAAQMGGFSAVGQPKDQGTCNTCVAFSVLSAAQSAIACALKRDATSTWSEGDFFYCKSLAPGEKRTCGTSWSMKEGIEALVATTSQKKYPTTENCLPYDSSSLSCSDAECQDVEPSLTEGKFLYVKLGNAVDMQQHIRDWGSVVTRIDVYSDFKPFFKKNPGGVYPGHGPKANISEAHAVTLVGYDLDGGWWLAKNSWSTDFASGGFFKIMFGVDSVGDPGDTYGLIFQPNKPTAKPLARLSPSTVRPGCYDYRALPSDYVSKVAAVWGLPISKVLLDNTAVIGQPDMRLGGTTLLLCGLPPGMAAGAAPTAAPVVAPSVKAPAVKVPPAAAAAAAGSPVKLGSYQGIVTCDVGGALLDSGERGKEMNVDIKLSSLAGGAISMELKASVPVPLFGDCRWEGTARCTTTQKSVVCSKGQTPLSCVTSSIAFWDSTCFGQPIPKIERLSFCYGDGALYPRDWQPTCVWLKQSAPVPWQG